ncbi:MAG: hypothetical protein ACOCXQ_02100 [Patescibacteria group bacterium]
MADITDQNKPEEMHDEVTASTEPSEANETAITDNPEEQSIESDEVSERIEDTEAEEEVTEDDEPLPASRETNQAMSILQIEEMVNQQMRDIAKIREEMKLVKGTVDDAFQNDAQYRELENKAKEAAKLKTTYKKQMMNDPAIAEQANKLDGMKSEIRDMQIALSDYLREYNRVSGMLQFETQDGEVLEIVNTFKLVKKKD